MTGTVSIHEAADALNVNKITPENLKEVTQFVKNKVYSSFIHAGGERTPGIHVSALLPDCMRKTCYQIRDGYRMDLSGIIRTGIGTHLHEDISIFDVQEVKLEYDGVVTDGVDEYMPKSGLFLDKKITWNPPSYGIWPTHKKQLEYYKLMLRRNKMKATEGFILYIDLSNPKNLIKLRHASKLRALTTVEKEYQKKKKIVVKYYIDAVLPERVIGFDCGFCSNARECLQDVI